MQAPHQLNAGVDEPTILARMQSAANLFICAFLIVLSVATTR
jgi:hypothetical protein